MLQLVINPPRKVGGSFGERSAAIAGVFDLLDEMFSIHVFVVGVKLAYLSFLSNVHSDLEGSAKS